MTNKNQGFSQKFSKKMYPIWKYFMQSDTIYTAEKSVTGKKPSWKRFWKNNLWKKICGRNKGGSRLVLKTT